MFSRLPLPAISAGFIAVIIGYTSSAAIVWQAALAAGASPAIAAGWLSALGVAMGISSLWLSLRYRAPVLTAWSTPGAALLATSLHGLSPAQSVGVFIFAAALTTLCGVTGLFARLMRAIPPALASAMLAGILLKFGLDTFRVVPDNGWQVGAMLIGWLACRRLFPRLAIIAALACGVAAALLQGQVALTLPGSPWVPPAFTLPQFSFSTLLGVGIPFFLVNMASQNAPGFAALQAAGYPVPASPLITSTGLLTMLLAPFGVFSVCIAAISAAVCQGEEAGPRPEQRWKASACAGAFYLLAGVSGGLLTALLAAFPEAFIKALAGLALLGTFSGSLTQALRDEGGRDGAIITFLVTASGIALPGVSSAFWGLVAGAIVHLALRRPRAT